MPDPARSDEINVNFTNPEAALIEGSGVLWIAFGLRAQDCRKLRDSTAGERGVEGDICRRIGDATVIKINKKTAFVQSIEAWKGLTSFHEVFYRCHSSGAVVLSDHFRNMLCSVPSHQRAPTKQALCEHFLFRVVPGHNTLCPDVKRLGKGEYLKIDLPSRKVTCRPFDRIGSIVRKGTTGDYLDRVDSALGANLSPLGDEAGVVSLFSGGVDSTLIRTYLPRSVPALGYSVESDLPAFEMDYGSRAAQLLGLSVRMVQLPIPGILERLEQVVLATGMPPPHPQFVNFHPLFETDHKKFVTGEQADAVFGIGVRLAKAAWFCASPLGRRIVDLAKSGAPSSLAPRLRYLSRTVPQLMVAPHDPSGFAAQVNASQDPGLLAALFGAELVQERLRARIDLLPERLEPSAPPSNVFLQHLETAQTLDVLVEDAMMCFRHLAHACGKTLVSPFVARDLLDSALSVPVDARYLRGFEAKYLLKRLLKRRLPGYPVDQRKGYMSVPLQAFRKDRGFAQFWERYDMPEEIDPDLAVRLKSLDTPLAWNAITLALWREKVQKNEGLALVAGSRVLSFQAVQSKGPLAAKTAPGLHDGPVLGRL